MLSNSFHETSITLIEDQINLILKTENIDRKKEICRPIITNKHRTKNLKVNICKSESNWITVLYMCICICE